MIGIRALLLVTGAAVAGYGATLLWDNPQVILVRILIWAACAVLIHDAVFAPLCLLIGLAGRTILPPRWRSPVAVGILCSVVLAILAIPVFDKPGQRPDNSTVLDRDYHAGLWISLGIVWVSVLTYQVIARALPVRKYEVVEHEGTDGVERQPPAA